MVVAAIVIAAAMVAVVMVLGVGGDGGDGGGDISKGETDFLFQL